MVLILTSPTQLDKFVSYLKRRSSSNTVKAYKSAFEDYLAWLGGRVSTKDTAQEYIDFLEASGKANNTVLMYSNAIKRYFDWQGNPIKLDSPRMQIRDIFYYNKSQLDTILGACGNLLEKTVVTLLMDTACRKSEILNLDVNDIDWKNKLITVTRKGGRIDRVNVSDRALNLVKAWLVARKGPKSGKVFMDMNGYDMWRLVHKIGRRVGIKVFPHAFRHTRAVQLLMSGADPHVVMMHLGHKRIGTTLEIYGRFLPMDYKDKLPQW